MELLERVKVVVWMSVGCQVQQNGCQRVGGCRRQQLFAVDGHSSRSHSPRTGFINLIMEMAWMCVSWGWRAG
jgi:hypothetical protein